MCSLTAAEKACVIRVRMRNLIATLEQLVEWIQIGVYDFYHLPLAMKKKIVDCDEIIKQVHIEFQVSGKYKEHITGKGQCYYFDKISMS